MRRSNRRRGSPCRTIAKRIRGTLPAGEPLEPRLTLSATLGNFLPGIWRINGDATAGRPDDTIVVERNPANSRQLRAVVNGVVVGSRPEHAVVRIVVSGGQGIDTFYGVAGVDRVRLEAAERLIGNESTNPLKKIDDLAKLEGWYYDTAMAQWDGQLGKETGSWWGLTTRAFSAAPAAGGVTVAGLATGGDFTGTNNQVDGVDEADHAKTDGEHLYVIAGDGVDILDVSAAGALAAVSHVTTPGDERAIFLHGARLTVISQESRWEPLVDDGSTNVGRFAGWWNYRWQSQVCVTVVDVSTAGQPAILETTRLDGWFVAGRAIDDRVIVVTQDSFAIPAPAIIAIPPPAPSPAASGTVAAGAVAFDPAMGGIMPPVSGDGTRYFYEDAAAYRARLERAWEETAIPGYTVTVAAGSSGGDMAVPGRTYLPVAPRDNSLLSVVSFDVDDTVPGPESTTTVAGASGQVYVSDPANPLRTATYTFPGNGWHSWSAALWDHRAVGWFARQGILAIPVQESDWWDGGANGLVVFKVDPGKGADAFTNLGRIDHKHEVTRSVRVGEYLYSVSRGEVRVHRIDDPMTEIGRVELSPPQFVDFPVAIF